MATALVASAVEAQGPYRYDKSPSWRRSTRPGPRFATAITTRRCAASTGSHCVTHCGRSSSAATRATTPGPRSRRSSRDSANRTSGSCLAKRWTPAPRRDVGSSRRCRARTALHRLLPGRHPRRVRLTGAFVRRPTGWIIEEIDTLNVREALRATSRVERIRPPFCARAAHAEPEWPPGGARRRDRPGGGARRPRCPS